MPTLRQLPLICLLSYFCISLLSANNVLLIIADDLGRDSLAKFNDDLLASLPPTPAIDSLADGGILFERAYAYSTCSPTRASILTGRYDFRTGVLNPETNQLQANEYTLAEAIVDSGAIGTRLAQLGKWHLGGSADAPNIIGGWPHYAGGTGGGIPNYSRWSKVTNGITTNRYTTYATTDVVNDAIEWIEDQRSEDWFLWLAFNAPHTPYHKPDNSLHDYDALSGTEEDITTNPRPYYEAMVQAMDTEIGRLLQTVDLSTTTVIFIGDNGTPMSVLQEPFPRQHGKGTLYEGGVNVPMIITGAAIPNDKVNTVSHEIIHCVDLYATILDLLGIDSSSLLPSELVYDTQSFYPLLTGATATHTRKYAFSGQPGQGEDSRDIMLTNEDYKWILADDGSEEFYYLADGLAEDINRINSLNTDAQLALSEFQKLADDLVNVPTVHRVYIEDGSFNIEIGWFANAELILLKSSDLDTESWLPAGNAVLTDNETSVLKITDQDDLATQRFYLVESN